MCRMSILNLLQQYLNDKALCIKYYEFCIVEGNVY